MRNFLLFVFRNFFANAPPGLLIEMFFFLWKIQDASTSPSARDVFIPPDDEQPSTSRSATERDEVDEDDPDDLSEPTTSSEDKPGNYLVSKTLAKWEINSIAHNFLFIN